MMQFQAKITQAEKKLEEAKKGFKYAEYLKKLTGLTPYMYIPSEKYQTMFFNMGDSKNLKAIIESLNPDIIWKRRDGRTIDFVTENHKRFQSMRERTIITDKGEIDYYTYVIRNGMNKDFKKSYAIPCKGSLILERSHNDLFLMFYTSEYIIDNEFTPFKIKVKLEVDKLGVLSQNLLKKYISISDSTIYSNGNNSVNCSTTLEHQYKMIEFVNSL